MRLTLTREFSDVLGKPSQLTGDVFKRIFQPVAGLRGQPSLSARILWRWLRSTGGYRD